MHSLALMRDCSTKAGAIAGCTGAACESGFVVALCSIISFLAAASAVIPLRSCRAPPVQLLCHLAAAGLAAAARQPISRRATSAPRAAPRRCP